MLNIFRTFMNSKIGVGVTLAFVVLIALAFALGDALGNGGLRGFAQGSRAALVGGESITTATLEKQVRNSVENIKQQDPKFTLKQFVTEEDGVNGVLDELINRTAVQAFAKGQGLVAGERLVGRELGKIQAFRGLDGQFSEAAYRQVLAQRGLVDADVRAEFAQNSVTRLFNTAAQAGAEPPKEMALRYAQLLTETRQGQIAILPALAFAPKAPPSDAEVTAWYNGHKADFTQPERRTVRYAVFDESAIKTATAPTDAEVAARYNTNKAQYAASETRSVSQLILPTQPAAQAVLAELSGGKTLEAAAITKGLSVAKLSGQTREALTTQTSAAIAEAVFAASKGKLLGPVKAPLGWALIRLDGIESKPARTLDQAKPELVAQLTTEKHRAAVADFSAKIEDEFDNGASLGDVAKELGLTIATTEPLTADGQVFGKPGTAAPAVLAKAVSTAFAMEREGQPQLAELEAGKTYMVFDVGAITPSAPSPIDAVKPLVVQAIQMSKGTVGAKAAAQKVENEVRAGTPLAKALAALGVPLPPIDSVNMPRQQFEAVAQKQQVPPPLQLLFAMAKGSVKLMGAPQGRAWYVVRVDNVVPGQVQPSDPRLDGLRQQMRQVTGREYALALAQAIRKDMGVKRDEAAIKALTAQLKGN